VEVKGRCHLPRTQGGDSFSCLWGAEGRGELELGRAENPRLEGWWMLRLKMLRCT